jgi:hypothetical protein
MLQQQEYETCGRFGEDVAAAGIRNLREVNNAERYVIRVRRWSIVPRRIQRGRFGEGRLVVACQVK